jgi:hypothetical protein
MREVPLAIDRDRKRHPSLKIAIRQEMFFAGLEGSRGHGLGDPDFA